MSDALRRAASDRMRRILRALTTNIIFGVLVGAGITAVIQSSSATTVMVVGFVNAGLMTLKQAIGVILGSNIGTTITAWLVSGIGVLKITNYALPAIGIGLVLSLVGKRQWRHWGNVLLGFGLLFFGLYLMKGALEPVGQSDKAKLLMFRLAGHPLTGILIGVAVTMIIQSSSATIAVAQLMAFQGI
ncbi:MAG: Na/Pi cotransporter family protein, partial [Planctomycetota bacterium]